MTRQQKSAGNRTKSIDFFIAAMGQRILIPAKYTVGDGGAQDNQRIDLHGVIAAAATLQAPDALIAVADGSHYSKPRPSGTTHFQDLSVQATACGQRVKVSRYADLEHDVRRMLGL